MPLHQHPVLRFREEAMEQLGHIQPLDSQAITLLKGMEAAGTRIKVVPPVTMTVGNTKIVAK